MTAHDRLDGLGCFVGVIEGDGGNVVVQDVGFDDAVEESAANETEFAVNGCGGSANVAPASGRVVGECGVSVLEVGDCNCNLLDLELEGVKDTYRASGSPRGRE